MDGKIDHYGLLMAIEDCEIFLQANIGFVD